MDSTPPDPARPEPERPRTERRAVVFSGRVQGVGFRASVRSIARRFLIAGWARNEPDGTVRVEAQGPPDEVSAFLGEVGREWASNITGVRSEPLAPVPDEAGFQIRH